MIRLCLLLGLLLTLASCNLLNMTNNKAEDQYARCKEIKRQLLFQNATNDERIATQRRAEIDNLYRSYRENGCN